MFVKIFEEFNDWKKNEKLAVWEIFSREIKYDRTFPQNRFYSQSDSVDVNFQAVGLDSWAQSALKSI